MKSYAKKGAESSVEKVSERDVKCFTKRETKNAPDPDLTHPEGRADGEGFDGYTGVSSGGKPSA